MKPIYLIHLTGQGDNEYILVDQEVWDWVTGPLPEFNDDGQAIDAVPPTLAARFSAAHKIAGQEDDQYVIFITVGSPENDRLLEAGAVAEKICYSYKEMADYVRTNNLNVIDETSGLIY